MSPNHEEFKLNQELIEAYSEITRLKKALEDIYLASRDDGLAAMCNWMRGRALAALTLEKVGE